MAKQIELANRRGIALVDDADYELVSGYRWRLHPRGYAVTKVKLAVGRWWTVGMHRLVMNAQAGEVVDHCNHDKLDNTRANLRICNNTENRRNARKALVVNGKVTSSRFKGIHWNRRAQKWQAEIVINGKKLCIGRFCTETEAACAYDGAAREHFGDFALFNFPDG